MTKEANEEFLIVLQTLLEDYAYDIVKNVYRQTDVEGNKFLCVEQYRGETVIVRVGG